MANRTPRDRRPPDTAVVFCVTLRRRRRGEPWTDDAVSTIRNPDHDTIRTQQVAPPDSRQWYRPRERVSSVVRPSKLEQLCDEMTNLQLALVQAFAAAAVCADLAKTPDRPSPTAWVIATLKLLLVSALLATLVMAFRVGPWWRIAVTFFGGGALGGIEAVILRRLPRVVTVITLVASWTHLIILYSQR